MKYSKYPEYKSLSFPFLDEIPSSWMVVPLYALSNFRQGKLHEPYIHEDGEFICINARFVSTEGKKFKHCNVNLSPVKKSDILMVMSDLPNGRALAKALYVTEENNYALNQRVCAITATNIYPKFLYYQLNRNAYFLSFDDGSNQTNLSNYDFKKYPVLLPSKQEQQTIANYLDKATAKIDTLIEKQTKLIDLLKEKRQAVISTAVTRGLDDTVAMKESGVEWLGEIPDGWEVKKLKYSLTLQTDKVTINNQLVIALENIDGWSGKHIETDSGYKGDDVKFQRDDVLFGKLRPYLAKVYQCQSSGVAFGDILVYRPTKQTVSRFAFYTMISEAFIDIVDGSTYGSKMPRASVDFVSDMPIAVAPKQEQQEIANYLDEKTSKIDNLITKSTKAIDLLKEKRTALISAVVTGKIDVRTYVKETLDEL